MNLPRVFTLAEANLELPEVLRITQECIDHLASISAAWNKLPFRKYNAIAGATEESLIQANWARRIAARGIVPKGYFVVDFASPDDDTYYCWAYGEGSITYEHKVWETFADRRVIEAGRDAPEKPSAPTNAVAANDDLADDVGDVDVMPDETKRDES